MYMKKRNIIIISFVFILVIIFILKYYIEDKYDNKLINEIKKNTDIEDIVYAIKGNDNYVVTCNNKLYVLDLKYKKILTESIDNLYKRKDNLKIVYKRNKLMYENTILYNDYVIYEYYDVYTNDKLDEIEIWR